MPLNLAQANALSLSRTLMVCVILFATADGLFGVMLAAEFDGDPSLVVREYDPFAP